MDSLYPPSPKGVPADLTAPTTKYRLHVTAVLTSVALFVGLYLVMIAASMWLVYVTLASGPWRTRWGVLLWVGAVVAAAMLFAFLLKGLFKRRSMDRSAFEEVTATDHPQLFAFIDRLCSETGAPRPKRVYLTPDVNAAVFYDSSFLSLFFPVRKNLLIGLGLVNVLTLDEFKAVLAHEFGHFAQSTMRLGSYVYVASGVMQDMIYGRDKWDDLLAKWQRADFRIAIFGWVLGAGVWVLRKFLALVFMGIHLVNAALTRQMEFHADSVAVSVSGSDSLIRALSRLVFADRSLAFGGSELAHAGDHGLFSDNLFLHQTAAADHLRAKLRDPKLGMPPDLPDDTSRTVEVFDGTAFDDAPSMWATHPPNHERELNAKRIYVRSQLDARPAWSLFADPQATQRRLTERLYAIGAMPRGKTLTDAAEVQIFIDEEHRATSFDPRWRGAYDDRAPAFEDLAAELDSSGAPPADPREILAQTIGPELDAMVAAHSGLHEEVQTLSRVLRSGGRGQFRFRGELRDGREAQSLFQEVIGEAEHQHKQWDAFDLTMLRVHRALAGEHEAELVARYRFYEAVQRLGAETAGAMRTVEDALGMFQGAEMSEQELADAFGRVAEGWDAFDDALNQADEISVVPLPNMKRGAMLGEFLLDRDLAPRAAIEARNLDGEWLQTFFSTGAEVSDKLLRLRQKCWSSIVRLHERIDPV